MEAVSSFEILLPKYQIQYVTIQMNRLPYRQPLQKSVLYLYILLARYKLHVQRSVFLRLGFLCKAGVENNISFG
jgi:hypothetical protein